MRQRLQVLLLLVLLAAAGWAAARAARRMREFRRTEAICAAVDAGDWSTALARAPRRTEPERRSCSIP